MNVENNIDFCFFRVLRLLQKYSLASRVEWCACFVHWCMNQCGIASYPTKEMTGNNAYCQSVANWFQSNGRWGDETLQTLYVAGDTIFFDWEGDGHTDHIGLVIGRDESKVYTVEGNGDAVKCCSYPIDSVIYGYGLMNY